MKIPTRIVGQAPGVVKGGTLVRKKDSLVVIAYPKDMPDHIDVDVSHLDFHHAVKVGDIARAEIEFSESPNAPIAVVEVPRAAKMEVATTEAAPAEAPAAGAEKKEEPKK